MEITQEYFIIYHNNANRIGLLKSEDVKKILSFMFLRKDLLIHYCHGTT